MKIKHVLAMLYLIGYGLFTTGILIAVIYIGPEAVIGIGFMFAGVGLLMQLEIKSKNIDKEQRI